MSKPALKCSPRNLETTSHQLSITNYMLQIYCRVDKVDQIYCERAETVYKGKGSYWHFCKFIKLSNPSNAVIFQVMAYVRLDIYED